MTCFRSVASRVLLGSEGLRLNIIYINTLMIQSFKTEAKLFNSQCCSSYVIHTKNTNTKLEGDETSIST